jgi:hypothetical protein
MQHNWWYIWSKNELSAFGTGKLFWNVLFSNVKNFVVFCWYIYSYFGQWQCLVVQWHAYISYAAAVSTFRNVILILLVLCHGACSDVWVHTNSPMIMPISPYVPWCGITNTGQSKIWGSLGTGCGSYFLAGCYTVWFGRQVLMFLKKLLPPYFSVYRTSHVAPAALDSTH